MLGGPWVNLRHGRRPRDQVTVLATRRTEDEDVIERYSNFNTKGFPEGLIFGYFNNQPIPSTYSDPTNDYEDNFTP